MLRPALFAIAVTASLALTSTSPSTAVAQAVGAPLELNQTLLDRWLIVIPAINRLAAPGDAPQMEDAGQAQLERICIDAGFETHAQCTTTIGYVGILIGGFDPTTKTFKDPVEKIRARIADIEANTQLPVATKEQMTTQMREMLAGFRHTIPTSHLHLMTANARHIFKTLATHDKK